jgi:hypothetical protein
MFRLFPFVLAAALCMPAFAQKMGSSNANAAVVKQTVTHENATFALDYHAINWVDGKMMKLLADKEKGARQRQRVNGSGPQSPLATFNTSVACKCGDLELAAGEYKVYFTITEDCTWQINFLAEGQEAKSLALGLMDTPESSKILMMCLFACADEGAGVYLAFGDKFCILTFAKVAPKDGDK